MCALAIIEGIDGDALVTGLLYHIGDVLQQLNEPLAWTVAEKAVE